MSLKSLYYSALIVSAVALTIFGISILAISESTDGKTPKSILAAEILNLKLATLQGETYEFGTFSRKCKKDQFKDVGDINCGGIWSDQDIATDVCAEFSRSSNECIVIIANSNKEIILDFVELASKTNWICSLLADESLSIEHKHNHLISVLSKEFRCEEQGTHPIKTILALNGPTTFASHRSKVRILYGMELSIHQLNTSPMSK